MESKEDKLRDAWLKSQGFKVLRFWNKEVLRNIEGVLKVIENAIPTPPPYPPPSRGRTGFVEQSGEN
jgi:very-short-patch-repair endonuclease